MEHVNQQMIAVPTIFRLRDVQDDQAADKHGVKDLNAVDTSDTLDEWSGHFGLSEQANVASCESLSVVSDDEYTSTELQSEEAPASDGFVVPQNIVVVSDSLRSALSDVEQAAHFFLENVDDLRFDEYTSMQEFVGEVRALKQRFLEQILPKVSKAFEKHSASAGERHCLQKGEIAFVEGSSSGEATLPKESSFDLSANLSNALSSLHLPLKELAERTEQQDHSRMLAVLGVDALGIDSLGALRKHFERKGKVEFISQPRITSLVSCALVRMEKATDALCISSAGRHHTINNVQLVVHRLADVNS